MNTRPAGHALVEALIAQGVHTASACPARAIWRCSTASTSTATRIRFIACRQEGGAAFMAEAQGKLSGRPGICFVTRGPGATNASIGAAHGLPGLDADDPVRRPGGQRPARPRGLPGGRLPADVRPRHAGHGQVGGRGAATPTACPSTWRAPSTPRCRAAPARWCWCCPRTCSRTPTAAPVLPRVEPALAWPAPGALRDLRAMLLAAQRPLRDRRRQRLGRRGRATRCSALPRTGSCRWAAASASRTPSTTAMRCMPATWASASTPSWRRACARPIWSSPWACAWAR